ncbi:helix-turn-helix domain-containing protein [Halobacterium sp. R2-5]|uniref:helix-turn-helix domain-containing protein n=1 Tax=Halobacterium sp. R2-5 TaxID=2715751 RepID=UPI0014236C90|nr:helix-turn-helix domain-containing protein [Halobacterium sp. R2-5]NIC00366.1 DNA-binding protein [Halobacterium sp. R2-5]
MSGGIRVTVEFPAPPVCPIADLSERANTTISDVSTSVAAPDANCVTEFLVDADAVPEDYGDPVFEYADRHLYRVTHDADADCPCVCLGEFETPVDRFFANAGDLEVVFHARDFEELQTIVGEFRDRYPEVDIQRLVRAPTGGTSRDTVFVDRGTLTERQLEALQTAYDMGYFEKPRGANATDVADELDITASTFTEHLAAAQRKLFADVLEEDA